MLTINGNSVNEIDVFRKVILKELNQKPVLCKFAQDILKDIPEYFWYEAASSSGKYHPMHDLGEGGLARHSLMVYRWLMSLMDANAQDMSEYLPGMIVAALFHDCCKRGLPENPPSENTVHEHPLYAAKFILERANRFAKENKDFIEMTADDEESFLQDIAVAASCIQSHMGKRVESKHSETHLPAPKTPMEYMVHLADYCASRKFTTFDVEFFNEMFR